MEEKDLALLRGDGGASSSDGEFLPLPLLFTRAAAAHRRMDTIFSKAREDPQLMKAALDAARVCDQAVERAALFSANEEQDDISTADLRMMLAPFFLAELAGSCPANCDLEPPERASTSAPMDPRMLQERRLSLVDTSVSAYSRFLTRAAHYKLLGELGTQMHAREEDEKAGPMDPSTKRMAKIEKFKRDKSINSQLDFLESRQTASAAHQDQDGQESGPLGGAAGWDEEDERHLWKLKIEQAALRALEQRQMLQEEQRMLRHILSTTSSSSQQRGSGGRSAREEVEQQQKAEMLEKLREVASNLNLNSSRPSSSIVGLGGSITAGAGGITAAGNASFLTNAREILRQGVFRPGHNLPTMTLDELAHIEMEDARRREEAERAAHAARAARIEELGSDEDEEELMRQRARDDFNDANPRGWGNSKLKPCG